MNTFVTSSASREHLRHSRYNVSREMVEADHAEAIDHARDLELARFGVNIYDVEGLGYEALHLMRAEAVELDVFRDEVARHLSGAELDAAVLRYARDLEGRPRCAGCLYVDEHPVDCPFHPAVLEEARANVLARTSQDITPEGLDLYADYLRATAASH